MCKANLIGRRTRKRCGNSLVLFRKSNDIDSHIQLRQILKTCEPATYEFLRRLFVAEEPLEVGGGDLDEGLEEVSLLGIVPHGMPESFEDLVTFPPVGKVVEVNPIEIVL